MNKQNKIYLVGLSILFTTFIAMAAYLFFDDEPMNRPAMIAIDENTNKKSDQIKQGSTSSKSADMAVTSMKKAGLSVQSDSAEMDINPYVFYPDALLDMLGIDMDALIYGREEFKNTITHVEWMDRINEILKNIDPEKKDAIIKNHTSLLYIKDLLNKAYLTGKIDHETFIKAVADLMKWHQKTYELMLTGAEYEALFELTPEVAEQYIDVLLEDTPEYSFILNQKIPTAEVTKQIQGFKLEEVNTHFKKMVLNRDEIGKQINSGEMTLERAREALSKSEHAFISRCKEILTEKEINTIFGSVAALESGKTQTEPPAVLGDADIEQLGFEIENPQTSVDMVREKLDKNKIEDIQFFYQQRELERQELLSKLDDEKIKQEEVEKISVENDAAFEENCRDILTEEEYKMIFDRQENAESLEQDQSEDITQKSTENEDPESVESIEPVSPEAVETIKHDHDHEH